MYHDNSTRSSRRQSSVQKNVFTAMLVLMLHGLVLYPGAAAAQGEAYTPERGSPERTAVLDALRAEVEQWVEHEIIFYHVEMRVLGDWAWTTVEPRTRDGRESYEPINALLFREGGTWGIIDTPSCDVDEPECFDDALFYKRVMTDHPEVPAALFPPVE